MAKIKSVYCFDPAGSLLEIFSQGMTSAGGKQSLHKSTERRTP
jgi:hypothetical protein